MPAEHGVGELAAWDCLLQRKLKQHRYAISTKRCAHTFRKQKWYKVYSDVVKRIFGIRIKPHLAVETWHPDVRFWPTSSMLMVNYGQLLSDPAPVRTSAGGARMDDCVGASLSPRWSVTASGKAYLTCNFNGPVDGKVRPALFTQR